MSEVRPELLFVAGGQEGDRVILNDNLVIAGRSNQAGVLIKESCVSRKQAQFALTREGWIIENLSGNTPLIINDKKYKTGKKVLLDTGDVIRFGQETEILFVAAGVNPVEAVAHYRQQHAPAPEPVPVPVPVPPPVATDAEPLPPKKNDEKPPSNAENEEPLSPEEIEAMERQAKMKKIMVFGGTYVALMVVIFGALFIFVGNSDDEQKRTSEPVRLETQDIEKAFNSDLVRNPSDAALRHLHLAQQFYIDRHKLTVNLYLCNKHYRLYMAYRPEGKRYLDHHDRNNFEKATDELVQKIEEIYNNAYAHAKGTNKVAAYDEFNRIRMYVPVKEVTGNLDKEDPVVKKKIVDNVLAWLQYISGKYLNKKRSRR